MTQTTRNRKGNIISLIIMIALIGVTLYMIFTNYSPAEILNIITNTNPWYLIAALIMMLLYVGIEGYIHHTVTRSLGENTTFGKGIVYASVDLYFSAITPSSEGGQPLMVYTMTRDGISISKSTVAALLFTNMFTSGLLICTGVAMIISPDLLFTDNVWFRLCLIVGLVISFIIFIGCVLLIRFGHTMHKLGIKLISFFHRIHLIRNEEKALNKLKTAVDDFAACSDYIKANPLLTIRTLILATLQRIVFFTVPYFIYLSFGLSGAGYFDLFAIQVITQMSVYALPIPGSAGATEAMMLLLYQNIYPEDLAVSAMLLARAVTFYFTVLFCGSVTLIDSIKFRKKRMKESTI